MAQSRHRLLEKLPAMQSGRDLSPNLLPEIFSTLGAKVMNLHKLLKISSLPVIELADSPDVGDRHFSQI
jgi:hypothetical protein